MRATVRVLTPLLWIIAPLAAAFIAPVTARAQERVAAAASCPESSRVDVPSAGSARQLYRRGERLYAAGRYHEAVAAYRAALSRSGRAALLFDLANTYERMGEHARAADALARYLSCVHPPDADLVRQRVRALRRRALSLAPGLAETAPPAPAQPPGRLARARPWFIGAAGASIAALLLHLAARAARPPVCASLVGTRSCQVQGGIDWSAGLDRAAALGAITGAVGLAVGGLILVRPAAGGAQEPRPGNAPAGAMLVLSGHF